MSKEVVSFENMLASLLLKFGKVNVTDIKVIQNDLFRKYGIVMSPFAIDYKGISNYVMNYRNTYYQIDSEETKLVLEEKQGEFMKNYVQTLNVEDLVLLKINELGSISEYDINTVFSEEQESIVSKLVDDLKVIYVWNDDILHDDYQEIKLTSLGQSRVFELQYTEQIEEFRELLISSGYDAGLISDFLRVQDFDKDVYDILNLDNFLYFCNKYDRAANAPGVSSVIYKKAEYIEGEGFDNNTKEMLSGMLSVWDDGHCIYICHPNHLFEDKYLTQNNHNIRQVNWDNINFDKMVQIGDYKSFIMPDSKEAFKYVHKRLGHQVIKKQQEGVDETSFLVVLEKYILDSEDQYIVRGLIRGDKEGYSLGFNPEYEEIIPKSVWEKSIRFSGREVPGPYLIKRYPNKKN